VDVTKVRRANAKLKRESAMLTRLQNLHGYRLLAPTRGMEKTLLMFDRKSKNTGVAYVVRLAAPSESALGTALAKLPDNNKKGTKKR
jgi:hypothetical protein